MRTIVITNMKGGVSKTTTALSLAKGMADKGYKTLLIDSDPQANATDVAGNIGNELDEKFINEFNDDIYTVITPLILIWKIFLKNLVTLKK